MKLLCKYCKLCCVSGCLKIPAGRFVYLMVKNNFKFMKMRSPGGSRMAVYLKLFFLLKKGLFYQVLILGSR
jgi:hypothetical protein